MRPELHGRLRGILLEIEADGTVSQRHLARRLGIALGLTNLLIRRIVAKGWVQVVHLRPNRVRYLLTPAGLAAKSRLTREYLQRTLKFYAEARERVRDRFRELSADLERDGASKRIAFYGVGEIAEIAYISLQHSDLTLIAVVADAPAPSFFGVPVHSEDCLCGDSIGGRAFDRLVVMSFSPEGMQERLSRRGVPAGRVFWL